MNKKLIIGLLTLVLGSFVLMGGSQAFAADSTISTAPFLSRCGQAIGNGVNTVQDAITKLLGMNQSEIQAKRQGGESLSQIASDKGVDQQKLVDTLAQAHKERLDQAVKDGYLTQDQANDRLEWMKQNVESKVNNTGSGFGHRGFGRGFVRGNN